MPPFTCRVYYEDTDLAGIVYYANYLKYIERARTEWVRAQGIDQVELKARGLVFAVRHLEADYLKPARFDDLLTVTTEELTRSPARLILTQQVLREATPLFTAKVTLVCLKADGTPTRLPL